MKKTVLFIIAFFLLCTWVFNKCACAQPKTINGVKYKPYGLLNENSRRNPNIRYRARLGPTVTGVVLSETIVVPAYIFLYNYWEPVEAIVDTAKK